MLINRLSHGRRPCRARRRWPGEGGERQCRESPVTAQSWQVPWQLLLPPSRCRLRRWCGPQPSTSAAVRLWMTFLDSSTASFPSAPAGSRAHGDSMQRLIAAHFEGECVRAHARTVRPRRALRRRVRRRKRTGPRPRRPRPPSTRRTRDAGQVVEMCDLGLFPSRVNFPPHSARC